MKIIIDSWEPESGFPTPVVNNTKCLNTEVFYERKVLEDSYGKLNVLILNECLEIYHEN